MKMLTDMKEQVNAIEMSADMRTRIVKNCDREMEKASMRKTGKMTGFPRTAIAIAIARPLSPPSVVPRALM